MVTKKKTTVVETPIRLDLGCGNNPREGFIGVDQYKMDKVTTVLNVVANDSKGNFKKWPWADNSVDEIHSSHFVEHLDYDRHNPERVHFFNEAWRVLKPGAKMTVITPHWCSNRAWGDPTHASKPVSEMSFFYLKKDWRESQAPHTDKKWNKDGFSCNFEAVYGYSFSPELGMRNQEYVQFALANYKEAAQDLHATLTKLE